MIIKQTKKVIWCFVILMLFSIVNPGCGKISQILFPHPPQNELQTTDLIGEITIINSEQFFTVKMKNGYEWNVWVNEDTKFHPITDANMDIKEIHFEDLKTGDHCSLIGQIKKPAGEGEIGEFLALEINISPIQNKLVEYSIFYSNNIMDPNLLDCNKVHPVKRMANENATFEEILLLLFEGPTEEEKKLGYISAIPDDVVINYIVRNDGVMRVDFKPFQIAGSCATAAFASQVKQTLLAISGTKEAIISVMGETEGILQP